MGAHGLLRTVSRSWTLRRMKPSEEIRRVIDRWLVALEGGDAGVVLERLSGHPGALTIGIDSSEWWHGVETLAVLGLRLEEVDPKPLTCDRIEAWEEATVGWAGVRTTTAPRSDPTSIRTGRHSQCNNDGDHNSEGPPYGGPSCFPALELPLPALRAEHDQFDRRGPRLTRSSNAALRARAGVRLCFPSSG